MGSSGHAARVAAPTIRRTEGSRVAGVLGSSPERGRQLTAEYPGACAYASLDGLAADDAIDAVWIAGPNAQHAAVAAACLRAGKHVLVEKPMATRQTDAEELRALADESGRTLKVGFQHRFRPGHEWLHAAVGDGRIGRVRLVRIHRFWPYPYFPGMPAELSGWRASLEESGGWVLNDIGAHLVDLALWLAGQPASVAFARTTNFKFDQASAEDTALLVLESAGGALLTIETSNAMSSFPGTVEVHGLDGWLRAGGTFDAGGSVVTHDGERVEFPAVTAADVYAASLRDFLAAVAGSPSRGTTAAEGAANVALIEEAVRRGRAS